MVRIPFAPAVSRQTIGSSAVIGVPDGDNPVQPIRPSRIGGKGRLIAEYADLIGAENLFAEYQCGLAAARGPPRSSPRRRPRRNPATSAGSRHRRKAAPIQQRQPAAGGFNWDRSWCIASTRTAGNRRTGATGVPNGRFADWQRLGSRRAWQLPPVPVCWAAPGCPPLGAARSLTGPPSSSHNSLTSRIARKAKHSGRGAITPERDIGNRRGA